MIHETTKKMATACGMMHFYFKEAIEIILLVERNQGGKCTRINGYFRDRP